MKSKTLAKAVKEIEYKLIEKRDFSQHPMEDIEFDTTEFRQCIFPNLSGISFIDCLFTECNLSNTSVNNTVMQDIKFKDCKLIGINFYEVSDFGFALSFEGCILDYASFHNKKMNRSQFLDCKMHGVNFSMANLSKSTMANCDLMDSVFSATNLSSLDLTSVYNFSINPISNNVKKAKFSSASLSGLLDSFDIIID